MSRGERALAAGVLIALGAVSAHAQSPEAEVLFREGRKLVQAGKLAEGCDKIEASERRESSVGALLNLGDCRERLGELASAWAAFRKAEGKAKFAGKDERRRTEARRRAALIEPKLSYLVVQVERPAEGLVVRRDGEPIDGELWGTAVPMDPGTYEISAFAPGYRPWQMRVTIDAKLRRRVIAVPALESTVPPLVAVTPVPPPMVVRSAAPSDDRGPWTPTRKVSAGLAAASVGALGAGIYFGVRANKRAEEADQRCPQRMCGDSEGLRLNSEARTHASRANAMYAAGGAAAVAAGILWFVGKPGETKIRPGVSGGVGVTLSRKF